MILLKDKYIKKVLDNQGLEVLPLTLNQFHKLCYLFELHKI